jgi:hypothetical protein
VERLHDRGADLSRADEEHPHERVAYFGVGVRSQTSATVRACGLHPSSQLR